jgi:ATP-dependent RNA helicase DeaD
MGQTFAQGKIPNAEEICEIQLMKLIQNTIKIEVKEKDIEKFMPQILSSFESMDKTEIIKKFVSAEFNRFIEYYDRSGDVNQRAKESSRDGGNRRDKGARARDEGKTRFFLSAGKRDGLNPGALLRVVCDAAGIKSTGIGRIDIMTSYAFFDVDEEHTDRILKSVNGTDFEGTKLSVEVTNTQNGGGSKGSGGNKRRSGGGSRGGGNFRSSRGGGDRRSGRSGDRNGNSERRSRPDRPRRHRGR